MKILNSCIFVLAFAVACSVSADPGKKRLLASTESLDGVYAQIRGDMALDFIKGNMVGSEYQSDACGAGKYYKKCWKKTMTVEVSCGEFKTGGNVCDLSPTK